MFIIIIADTNLNIVTAMWNLHENSTTKIENKNKLSTRIFVTKGQLQGRCVPPHDLKYVKGLRFIIGKESVAV